MPAIHEDSQKRFLTPFFSKRCLEPFSGKGCQEPFSRRRRRRGSAVLDAAFVLPILFTLMFGTVEYGHYFYWKHTLQGAAREGARAAIIAGARNDDVITAVRQSMQAAGIDPAKYTVKIRNPADTADLIVQNVPAGDGIKVKVYSMWGTVGVRPLGLIDDGKLVTGQTVMRKE